MNKYSERLYKYRSDVVASTVLGLVVMLIALSADPASSSTPSGALSPGLIEIQAPQEHQVHQPPPQEQNPTPPPTPSESSEADLDQQPEQTKKQEDTSVFGEVDQMEELDKPLTDAEITKRLEDYRQALIKGDLSIRLVGVSALSRKDLQSIARGYKVSSNGIAVYLDKQGHVCPAFRPEALTAPVQENMCPQAVRSSLDEQFGSGEKLVEALFVFSQALELEIYRKLALHKPKENSSWMVILESVSSGRPSIQIKRNS